MDNIVQLKKPIVADDVPAGLRRLADMIEAGEAHEGPVTTCVVVLGHSQDRLAGDEIQQRADHTLYGYGPRCDLLTVRGLLSLAMVRMGR